MMPYLCMLWSIFLPMPTAAMAGVVATPISTPLRILPLGDSITLGYYVPGGYRGYLFHNLTQLGYNVEFIGNEYENPTTNGAEGGIGKNFTPAHEGHSEWKIDQLQSNIELWLQFIVDPDIILLHIGTNDFHFNYKTSSAIDRLDSLITKICLLRPRAHLIITNLLERDEPRNSAIETAFNPFVKERVIDQSSLGHHVTYLDMRSFVPLVDLPDMLHPNATGYEKMSRAWSSSITALSFKPTGVRATTEMVSPQTKAQSQHSHTILLEGGCFCLLLAAVAVNVARVRKKRLLLCSIIICICTTAFTFSVNLDTFLLITDPTGHTDSPIINVSYNTRIKEEHDNHQVKVARSKEIIPTWMSSYLKWHNEQREKLRAGTGDDIKYLVVRCLEEEICGRLTDRIKPMPFHLLVANLTQRVLLVHWEKPKLEHFVIPPSNGLDWRLEGTSVTIDDIRSNSNFHDGRGTLSAEVRKMMGTKVGAQHLVEAKVLNINFGVNERTIIGARKLFNEWRMEPNQLPAWGDAYLGWHPNATVNEHDLFEDVFRIMFERSPVLQNPTTSRQAIPIMGKKYPPP